MMNKKHPGLNTNMDGEIGQGLFRRESSIRTGMKQQWSGMRVNGQSAGRMMYGQVRARLRMPASGWIPWVFATEMNPGRQGINENRLQSRGIRLGRLRLTAWAASLR